MTLRVRCTRLEQKFASRFIHLRHDGPAELSFPRLLLKLDR